jgi:hypothetical protein
MKVLAWIFGGMVLGAWAAIYLADLKQARRSQSAAELAPSSRWYDSPERFNTEHVERASLTELAERAIQVAKEGIRADLTEVEAQEITFAMIKAVNAIYGQAQDLIDEFLPAQATV